MELWLTLVVLYAWQCLAWLRAPSAVFGPRWLGASDLHRRGAQMLSPWPLTDGSIATRLPFEPSPDSRHLLFDARHELGTRVVVSLDNCTIDQQGTRIRIDSRVVAQAASKAQARHWHRLIAALASCDASGRPECWKQWVSDSLDAEKLRVRLDDARRSTRWLGRAVTLLCVGSFVVIPLLGILLGTEFVLARALPALGIIHVATLGLAFASHRTLFPDQHGERLEELFMATLYPPALWRRPSAWVDGATTGFHPLAWVRLLEDEDLARRIWRRERARLPQLASESDEPTAFAVEKQVIQQQWPELWLTDEARERHDPMAESYCPVCWDDFRAGFHRCAACDARTVPYSGKSAEPA